MAAFLRRVSLGVVLLLSSVATSAAQQATVADGAQSVEEMIARGIALRKVHANEEALTWFERALAREPSPRAQAHVALALQALGRWLEADAGLRLALGSTTDPWIARHRDELDGALRVVEAHLSSVLIECDAPGAELFVDGERAAALPQVEPVRITSGHHRLVVRASGFREVASEVEVVAGGHFRERVVLESALRPPESAPVEAPRAADSPAPVLPQRQIVKPPVAPAPTSRTRTTGLVTAGIGLVGVAIGSAFGLAAIATKHERDQNRNADGTYSAKGIELDGAGRAQATASTIAFAVGGIVLGAGAYLTLTAPVRRVAGTRNIGIEVGGTW
jgi:hypothetical protein